MMNLNCKGYSAGEKVKQFFKGMTKLMKNRPIDVI